MQLQGCETEGGTSVERASPPRPAALGPSQQPAWKTVSASNWFLGLSPVQRRLGSLCGVRLTPILKEQRSTEKSIDLLVRHSNWLLSAWQDWILVFWPQREVIFITFHASSNACSLLWFLRTSGRDCGCHQLLG